MTKIEKGVFFIPIEQSNLPYSDVLNRITKQVIMCDKSKFESAFFGEHLTDKYEKLSSSLMMIASLSNLTEKIKLGSMTANLNFSGPAFMTCLISTADNLSKGRLLLGIGCGSNQCDVEAVGNLNKDNYELMMESIKIIKELLNSKDLVKLNYSNYNVSTIEKGDHGSGLGFFDGLYNRRSNLEIIMPALGKNSNNVKNCAINEWSILSTNFCDKRIIKNHIDFYNLNSKLEDYEIKNKIRISRFIFVTENTNDAEKYLFKDDSPYLFMIKIIFEKLKKINKHYIFGDDTSSIKNIAKNIVLYGTPDEVSEKICDFTQEVGNFKTLVYTGISKSNEIVYDNSLELFSNDVQL